MPYEQEITNDELSAAMQHPEIIREIFQSAITNSIFLSKARRLPNMGTSTARMSVLDALPIAYFQATGTSLKKTTNQAWKGKTLSAEELAVIVPIGINVLQDATNVDIWAEVTPRIGEAMGEAIDAACFHGTNLPSTWLTTTAGVSQSLLVGATAAGMSVTEGTGVDLYDDIFGDGGVVSLVENQGFMVNGHAAAIPMHGKIRHVRANRTSDGAGLPIFADGRLDGLPISFAENGAIDGDSLLLVSGDWRQTVYSVRNDITATFANQGVIQDAEGEIVYNLFQQDMVAMRFVFRLAVQIANPVTKLSATEAARYPFAVLVPAGT